MIVICGNIEVRFRAIDITTDTQLRVSDENVSRWSTEFLSCHTYSVIIVTLNDITDVPFHMLSYSLHGHTLIRSTSIILRRLLEKESTKSIHSNSTAVLFTSRDRIFSQALLLAHGAQPVIITLNCTPLLKQFMIITMFIHCSLRFFEQLNSLTSDQFCGQTRLQNLPSVSVSCA